MKTVAFLVALCAALAGPLASENGAVGEPRLVLDTHGIGQVARIEVERVRSAQPGSVVCGEASAILADGSMVPLAFRCETTRPDGIQRWWFRSVLSAPSWWFREWPQAVTPPRISASLRLKPGERSPRRFSLRLKEGGKAGFRCFDPSTVTVTTKPTSKEWILSLSSLWGEAYKGIRPLAVRHDGSLLVDMLFGDGAAEIREPSGGRMLGSTSDSDGALACLGPEGDIRWLRGFRGAWWSSATVLPDDSFLLTLYSYAGAMSVERGDGTCLTVRRKAPLLWLFLRYDAGGVLRWHRVATTEDDITEFRFLPRPDGSCLGVVTRTGWEEIVLEDPAASEQWTLLGGHGHDAAAFILDEDGQVHSMREIWGSYSLSVSGLATFGDGSFVVAGSFWGDLYLTDLGGPSEVVRSGGEFDALLARYDADGRFLWVATAGMPSDHDHLLAPIVLEDSTVVVPLISRGAGDVELKGPSGDVLTTPFDGAFFDFSYHSMLLTAWGPDGSPRWSSPVESRAAEWLRLELAPLSGKRFLLSGDATAGVLLDAGGATETWLPADEASRNQCFLATFEVGVGCLGAKIAVRQEPYPRDNDGNRWSWRPWALPFSGDRAVVGCGSHWTFCLWPGEPFETRLGARGMSDAVLFTMPLPGAR